jgi:peptide chain release factor 3
MNTSTIETPEILISESKIIEELTKRRTFAIISHPDAGKTTLTEKLLLYAGMLRTAGMVGNRKSQKSVSSDWMELEQERGISITASAMQFNYKDKIINVLDTPGHQDFSEDTYRTLTAADSAVMLIDAANGVETQTKKLFKVCRMRGIPIITFVNKMDLPGKEPLSLLAEVEEVLNINASPMNWPIGSGKDFCGVVDLSSNQAILFTKSAQGGRQRAELIVLPLNQALEKGLIAEELKENLLFELDLLKEAGNVFSREKFLNGEITPVYFGSAMTNFGIEPFFDAFIDLAPAPSARLVDLANGSEVRRSVSATAFSGYVFKIQANMDLRHRDSMAFIRVCSGVFERDLTVKNERLKKSLRLSRSHSMFGGNRQTVDVAYPGDIIGVVNPGNFSIGDTISVDGGFNYKPLPKFPPEVVAELRPKDVLRLKSFQKGIEQFRAEGAVLILERYKSLNQTPLVAAVGVLQFEVLQYRLQHEYKVETTLDILPYRYGAWLIGDADKFQTTSSSILGKDALGNVIYLYSQEWERGYALEKNPGYELKDFI